jgi:hypothetical protein
MTLMDDVARYTVLSRRRFQGLIVGWLAAASAGCGTLMYPERRGQSRTGKIDWTVAGMDAIGLVLFLVPGVIAFAIDYHNGSLFLPEGSASTGGKRTLRTVKLTSLHPSREEIAAVLSSETGKPLALDEGSYVTRKMESLDEFWSTEQALIAEYRSGKIVLRCQSPQ